MGARKIGSRTVASPEGVPAPPQTSVVTLPPRYITLHTPDNLGVSAVLVGRLYPVQAGAVPSYELLKSYGSLGEAVAYIDGLTTPTAEE